MSRHGIKFDSISKHNRMWTGSSGYSFFYSISWACGLAPCFALGVIVVRCVPKSSVIHTPEAMLDNPITFLLQVRSALLILILETSPDCTHLHTLKDAQIIGWMSCLKIFMNCRQYCSSIEFKACTYPYAISLPWTLSPHIASIVRYKCPLLWLACSQLSTHDASMITASSD